MSNKAKELNRSLQSVKIKSLRLGIKINQNKPVCIWKQEEINTLKQLAPIKSYNEIGEILNMDADYVKSKAARLGLTRFQLDKTFFEFIDSEKKAYWLGFIMADGCVCKYNRNDNFGTREILRISLSSKDESHLIKFRDDINSNYKIVKSKVMKTIGGIEKEYPLSSISIGNTMFIKNLKDKGVTPNKTFEIPFPSFISKKLMKHFIRGFIDGDGWVSFYKRKDRNEIVIKVGVCGACEVFMHTLISILEHELDMSFFKQIRENKNTKTKLFIYTTSKKGDGIKLVRYLYENSETYLDRKYDKALDIMDYDDNYQ